MNVLAPSFPDARILIVDDEQTNVRLLERLLASAGYTRLTSTTDGREVAALVAESTPDLVLLDLHMPHRNGFEVLTDLQPSLQGGFLPVLVLTADVTRETRERALSSGAKDFLTKPLDTTEVLLRIRNLLETRSLYLEEKVLREGTLQGSIQALTEVLALVNPAGFSRAMRARKLATSLMEHLEMEPRWEVQVAAMLSQLGIVTLPAETVEKLYAGKTLSESEIIAAGRLPEVATRVVARIPRMEPVSEILAHQNQRFDGRGAPEGLPTGEQIPWGARLLKLVLDVDVLETRGIPAHLAVDRAREREGWYDPELVRALTELRQSELAEEKVAEVDLLEVRPGMILAEDVRTVTGILLVARGQEVSQRLVERLLNSAHLFEPRQRVHVVFPPGRRTPDSRLPDDA